MVKKEAEKSLSGAMLWPLTSTLSPAAEVEESQESSMTDADDTQLHTAESDEVL